MPLLLTRTDMSLARVCLRLCARLRFDFSYEASSGVSMKDLKQVECLAAGRNLVGVLHARLGTVTSVPRY